MSKPIVLERGYNTSGLYAFLTSMFYSRSTSVDMILNMDVKDIRIYYIQDFLKEVILERFQLNRSITVHNVNRFRTILFNFGWRKEHRHDIDMLLSDPDPSDIYRILFINGMQNKLNFERVEAKENKIDNISFDAIEIGNDDLVFSDRDNFIVDLSSSIHKWIQRNIIDARTRTYAYRFKDIPYMIPVFIDREINNTNEKTHVSIDIKDAIGFKSLSDPIQKIFIWNIQSIILYDDQTHEYYSLIKCDKEEWHMLSQSSLPSNSIIDMADPIAIKRIAKQIRCIFYKIK